jgi:hypothetical protein
MAYTNIDDPSAHFQTALYTGTGSTQSITNDGNSNMQPDWVWIKSRSDASWHSLQDSSRGATKTLFSNTTNVEVTYTDAQTSFDSDGFSLGADASGGSVNVSSRTYVAWNWKANGGTTSSNTDGSVTSTVQANQDAGFSIVTFTSAPSSGTGIFSVGHGLGQIPAMVITKSKDSTSNWWSWHKGLTGGNSNTSYIVALERITAEGSYSNAWGAGMTSSVFGMQSGNTAVASSDYVAYCFAEKQGFSKFGTYVGNGSTDGSFVYTGFKPALVILKGSSAVGSWYMIDNKRDVDNVAHHALEAQSSAAEYTNYNFIDMLSNGFKLRLGTSEINTNGNTYIYMAFAENPFTTSTGIPTTAR